jgi:hypothetical protein
VSLIKLPIIVHAAAAVMRPGDGRQAVAALSERRFRVGAVLKVRIRVELV